MANKVIAQEKISIGSFVVSISDADHLEKGKLYRVQSVKSEGRYITLDTKFCGTDALKGKTINFNGRFELISEDEVKAKFKEILTTLTLVDGQEFQDVRSGDTIKIDSNSRTHVLVKFGKFMGVKIAGGHAWFAGYNWTVGMKDMELQPERPEQSAKPSEIKVGVTTSIHTETKEQATQLCNYYNLKPNWIEHWDVYDKETVYNVNKVHENTREGVVSYGDVENSLKKKYIILSFEQWLNATGQSEQQEATPKRKTITMGAGSIEEQILAVVDEHLVSDDARKQMAENVEKLLNKWGIDKNVRQLEVKINEKEFVKVGKVHYKYDLVLKCMMARTNVALVGAAGSGKTTTVAKAAEALELKFYSKSVSAQTGAHEFFGYQDANGNYVRTLFRDAYENGGVFLLDEFDAGNPNVLAALNQATANEHCAFADGMIPKHKDFICVMAGNTFGHGANSEYVGRNKIDAATLDRFAFIEFPYDEDLEHALAGNKAWCKKVQAFRKKVEQKKIRTIISPRATLIGSQLLENGVSESDVMELVIFKGLNKEERNLLS